MIDINRDQIEIGLEIGEFWIQIPVEKHPMCKYSFFYSLCNVSEIYFRLSIHQSFILRAVAFRTDALLLIIEGYVNYVGEKRHFYDSYVSQHD